MNRPLMRMNIGQKEEYRGEYLMFSSDIWKMG